MYNHLRIKCEYDENSVPHKAARALSTGNIVDARLASALDKLEARLSGHNRRQVEIAELAVARAWARAHANQRIRDAIQRKDTMNKYLTLVLISLCACTTQFAYEDDTYEEGDTAAEGDTTEEVDAGDAPDTDEADALVETDGPTEPDSEGCVPDCSSRVCGPDPVCDETCGACVAPETCNGLGQCRPDWVHILAGTFAMGSPETELGRRDNELQHTVTLTRAFEIQATEVTQAQFVTMMGYNPANFVDCVNCPVENLTWHEAAAYCNALSAAEGLPACYTCTGSTAATACTLAAGYPTPYNCLGYRLPTEAEWEYASRATSSEATYAGDLVLLSCEQPNSTLDPIAWFCGNSLAITHDVKQLSGNAWGLYDMLGNVLEWCDDRSGSYPASEVIDPWDPVGSSANRRVRGGAWDLSGWAARCAYRGSGDPNQGYSHVGFRPVRITY